MRFRPDRWTHTLPQLTKETDHKIFPGSRVAIVGDSYRALAITAFLDGGNGFQCIFTTRR